MSGRTRPTVFEQIKVESDHPRGNISAESAADPARTPRVRKDAAA